MFDKDGTMETQLLQFAHTGYITATNLNNSKRVEALLCPLWYIIEFLRLFLDKKRLNCIKRVALNVFSVFFAQFNKLSKIVNWDIP